MDIRSANEEIRNLQKRLAEKEHRLVENAKYIKELKE